MAVDTPTGQGGLEGTPNGDDVVIDTPPTGKGKGGGRWMRLKRPIKELAGRIMIELRRKDEVCQLCFGIFCDQLLAPIIGGMALTDFFDSMHSSNNLVGTLSDTLLEPNEFPSQPRRLA